MPDLSTLLLFVVATLALLIVPGPAVVYIVSRCVAQGRSAGLISVAGVHVGSIVHVILAAFGISAILAASPTLFTIVKWAGAAYLVYLGIAQLRSKSSTADKTAGVERTSNAKLFRQGILINVLNPKTAIFFLAFLPQFAKPGHGPISLQILLFGIGFVLLGLITDSTYAMLAGMLAGRLRRTPGARRRLDVASGLVLIGLGIVAVVVGNVGGGNKSDVSANEAAAPPVPVSISHAGSKSWGRFRVVE